MARVVSVRGGMVITWMVFTALFVFPQAAQATVPGFKVVCGPDHSLRDDPIVFPGQPGVAHDHVFFGNKTTDATSTFDTLQGGLTNCSTPNDASAYWAPMVYSAGSPVLPMTGSNSTIFYYQSQVAPPVRSFPPGLKMVAGSSSATPDNPSPLYVVYWNCSAGPDQHHATMPYNCPGYDIDVHVQFPQCWDGANLDTINPDGTPAVNPFTQAPYPNDHKSHMSYPIVVKGVAACPPDHPVAVPRLIMRIRYPLQLAAGITLASTASGWAPNLAPATTAHADFFNAWNQDRLQQLVDGCINAKVACSGPIKN